jgi:protein-tyrosine-phosphatase
MNKTAKLPTVLFVCVHNSGRSQMVKAFFNHHYGLWAETEGR